MSDANLFDWLPLMMWVGFGFIISGHVAVTIVSLVTGIWPCFPARLPKVPPMPRPPTEDDIQAHNLMTREVLLRSGGQIYPQHLAKRQYLL